LVENLEGFIAISQFLAGAVLVIN